MQLHPRDTNPGLPKRQFRVLILVSVALYVAWFFFPLIESRFYSLELIELKRWSGLGASLDWRLLTVIAYGSMLAYGVIGIGLACFQRWARVAFLWLIIFLELSCFIFGINILTEAETAYLQLLNIINGFILAIVYFSGTSHEFATLADAAVRPNATDPG